MIHATDRVINIDSLTISTSRLLCTQQACMLQLQQYSQGCCMHANGQLQNRTKFTCHKIKISILKPLKPSKVYPTSCNVNIVYPKNSDKTEKSHIRKRETENKSL